MDGGAVIYAMQTHDNVTFRMRKDRNFVCVVRARLIAAASDSPDKECSYNVSSPKYREWVADSAVLFWSTGQRSSVKIALPPHKWESVLGSVGRPSGLEQGNDSAL